MLVLCLSISCLFIMPLANSSISEGIVVSNNLVQISSLISSGKNSGINLKNSSLLLFLIISRIRVPEIPPAWGGTNSILALILRGSANLGILLYLPSLASFSPIPKINSDPSGAIFSTKS